MTDINLKTETPDTTLPTTGFLFGADSQAAASPSVFTVQSVATTLLGSTTLTGATITADAPVLNLAQTWNNAAVTFTGLKFNATSTASAAASRLLDLQINNTSKFHVTRGSQSTGYVVVSDASGEIVNNNSVGIQLKWNAVIAGVSGNGLELATNGTAILSTRGTANLRFGAADAAAPVAQTLSVQSVVAGTSNTAGAALTITGSQGTGTGAGGSIIFQVAPAGAAPTVQNALTHMLSIASDATIAMGPFSYNTLSFGTGGELNFRVTSTISQKFTSGAICVVPAAEISWNSGALPLNGLGTPDVRLFRDASNTLAQRNANNGQIFRLYGRFTDITNDFERFFINAPTTSGDAVQLGTQKGATAGTARALELQTDATSRLALDTVGSAQIVTALTVATLPGTPLAGMIARVTDALAPVIGSTVASGGAAYALVNYNGANWTVIGV